MDSDKPVAYDDSLLALCDGLKPNYKRLIGSKTDAEFNDAFADVLVDALDELERNSKNYFTLGEDGLSAVLASTLNGTNALRVTREENTNGHVDLTFTAELCVPKRRVLGEAKIYDGYAWHCQGLSQLVARYSTGREVRGLLLSYFRVKNIKGLMEELRTQMDQMRPNDQTLQCADHKARWAFVSTHAHSSGEHVEVLHLGCNMYHESHHRKKGQSKPNGRGKQA